MSEQILSISGVPTPRQKLFFASRARFTAYGGARGGGKSWALRRKLMGLCLCHPGIRCLLVRRSLGELKSNHLTPLLQEYGRLLSYRERDRLLTLPNGSTVTLGYCSSERDTLRYHGQEYDIIAIDEATQLTEYQFSVLSACLRGTSAHPRRMYLTCNPGGVGHAWVKRLFVDRDFREGETPSDYCFVPAQVWDNPILMEADPAYLKSLQSLPPRLRDAWLYGRWDVFQGQFFPEFSPGRHICHAGQIPTHLRYFAAMDYGFDMLAVLLLGMDGKGNLFVLGEVAEAGLTLYRAAERAVSLFRGYPVEYLVASPDLWNRRQDTGRSGFEIMQAFPGMPPMQPADDRRIPGWRILRQYLSPEQDQPGLLISSPCKNLIASLPALLCDEERIEDASSRPHTVTHTPEALRYAVMSRCPPYAAGEDKNFRFPTPNHSLFF